MGTIDPSKAPALEPEREVSEVEERWRALAAHASDAVAVVDADGTIVEPNARWLALGLADLVDRDACRRAVATGQAQRAHVARGALALDVAYVRAGGRVLAIARDVSAQERARDQIVASDRLSSIGALAAGIAHEINNPLAVVMANLDLAVREVMRVYDTAKARGMLLDTAELAAELADARTAAEEVRGYVRDVKLLARADDDRETRVDVCRVLESALRLTRNEIKHRAVLGRDLAPCPAVIANEARLGQVFVDLLLNAVQAIPQGRAAANRIHVCTRHDAAAGEVVIEIADSGRGMAPEVRDGLRVRPAGTGLGLAVSQRIVAALRGRIEATSEAGRGTTVRVVLPAGDARRALIADQPPAAVATRRGQVLVIDDDDAVLASLRRILAPHHEVHAVASADAALAMIDAGRRFDVILCDVMMPETTGEQLHAALPAALADRVVFMTSGAFSPEARAFLERVGNPTIEKPLDVEALLAVVAGRVRDRS